ncbi:uncharacterized protein Eint_090840 [Encephalitozoon intestinalis ATCC 50506]|uniref:Uncharacterized protein n=1 Tax=Encephalitozoon intestinalis (strain ATCC 50506) TaxID=876142 RepID=E0S8U7_ENCIT|nr:uncharacterized protein Eint_090840 [Encephalitozoon intestinalis ATCC 50506]ADM12213.2 hypothetical protein Eint_090840 [Encephalitozoon intestinalis ATCC 50506]UTX46021.1 putative transportin [Encephalitozoon intestinalis]
MAVVRDIGFYIETDRQKIIETTAGTSPPSIADILSIPDIYVRYFLLVNLPISAEEGTSQIMKELKAFFKEFAEAEKIVEVDFDQKMSEFVKKAIIPVGMEDFVGCISELGLSHIDLEYYRGYFGYSQTYSLYKSMIKRIFSCGFSHKEIGLVMLLLDNETMCFKRLLPMFSRLTTYVTRNLLDKNIVACCIVLQSVLKYIPDTMNGRDEYVLSLISYLVDIVSRHTSFMFINEKDAGEIISTIDLLSRFHFTTSVSKTSSGILKEVIFRLESLSSGSMSLYEEVFAVVCVLETIPSICRLLEGSAGFNFSSAYSSLQGLTLQRVEQVGLDEWDRIHNRFLVAKYRSLESLHPWKTSFDRIMFYNDIERARHPSKVLRVLESLKRDISWSDMIVFACHPGLQEEWLAFMFDSLFVKNPEHLVYIELFVESIGSQPDLLLYSGYLLIKIFGHIETEKKWNILVDLFLRNIQSLDQRTIRLRCIISDYISSLGSEEEKSIFLNAFVGRLQKDFVCFNASVIGILHRLLNGVQRVSLETSRMVCLYIRGCAVCEWRREEASKDLEAMYMCVGSRAMILSGATVDFGQTSSHLERYYELIISCLSWIEGRFPEEYVDRIKETMLYFLLDADREQVHELGLLIRGECSRFRDKFKELYGNQKSERTGI